MIVDDVDAALPELRAQAESMMTDTCDIERSVTAWDEAQGKSVTTWAPIHTGIPCAFDVPPASSRSLLTDEAVTPETPVVKIPVTFDGVEPNDRVTLASGPVVWVTHSPTRTNQVQRRLACRWAR